ncbi:acyl carrier protein [Streptomyces sp. H10-C2]|uniref:acyl carrier protein n=1 Tax=unclassified Streptomyces TaxID=2593676 RepID=UPI0024BADB6E|nr:MULTISPECIES: acyl carrier protein [unclassified Streptomyces]MDJ0347454.1 acyl carrier protein [Streptomyces sp. PH10-H1]MDJ0375683.1 acyl carrier protein [Streptomyces sp. H10-C2]
MTTVPWDTAFDEVLRTSLPLLKQGEELLPGTPLSDYGLDSMGMMQLIARLETSHGVSFPPGTMPSCAFANPGVLWGMVQAAQQADEWSGADGARRRPAQRRRRTGLAGWSEHGSQETPAGASWQI